MLTANRRRPIFSLIGYSQGLSMKAASQIALVLAIVIGVAGGTYYLVQNSPSNDGVQLILPADTPTPSVTLKVYVSGAVRNPDVYEFDEGDRLRDAIMAAGGFTEDANQDAMNLAARLKDEDHWRIPRLGEEVSQETSTVQGASPSGKINIISADIETLMKLNGIGDTKAKAIISYREANGPFSSIEELVNVNGIAAATLNVFRDMIEVR